MSVVAVNLDLICEFLLVKMKKGHFVRFSKVASISALKFEKEGIASI
jgi:hypothetical protein